MQTLHVKDYLFSFKHSSIKMFVKWHVLPKIILYFVASSLDRNNNAVTFLFIRMFTDLYSDQSITKLGMCVYNDSMLLYR